MLRWNEDSMEYLCRYLKSREVDLVSTDTGEELHALGFGEETIAIVAIIKEGYTGNYYSISFLSPSTISGDPVVTDNDIIGYQESGYSPWEGYDEQYEELIRKWEQEDTYIHKKII
jgi:hypothetical protein